MVVLALPATADNDDPPTRVGRLAYARGSVSFQPSGTDEWVTATINRPVTVGDRIWSDNDARAELQLDSSLLRLSHNTGLSFLNLNDDTTQIELSAGTLLIRVRRLDENETYEIDAPNLAFSIVRPGLYRITVDEAGDSTAVSVRSGAGQVTGGGAAYNINARDSYVFSGTGQLYATREDLGEDEFESWATTRDRRRETSRSAHYVSTDVVGYEDLDDHGDWRRTPDYGNVWFPRVSNSDWAPYHNGHWCYIEPWGYTWVDDEPWGFAPFHYGRWVNYQGAWGWVPAPPRAESAARARPVYAPALVAWVGDSSGATVTWFPLGPREVYVPSYPVSRNYVNNVNVSNTTVSTTVVNNYYNTTVVNKTTTNVTYVNRSVPGAVAATTPQAFTTAQPITKNAVKVDQRTVANAPVKVAAPPVVPAKQAVLGNAPATAKPPANVQTRTVVAKATPPPPPPSFEKRQAAIQNNGGKPLSPAQMRQIQPASAARPAATVKVAPAAKPSTTPPPPPPNRAAPSPNAAPSKPAPDVKPTPAPSNPSAQPTHPAEGTNPPNPTKPEPAKPPTATPAPSNRPPERPPEHPASPNKPPTPSTPSRPETRDHPNQPPSEARPATPPSNPAMDNRQQQEQEQLHAKQEQERQKLQQQQRQEHARSQQQSDQTAKQKLERQHQQQTEQLQQKHAQEQKQLEQKQQQERQQKNKPQKKPEQPQP